VVAALYRRYRPETFAELIGQSQVTDPLRTALRTDRVNHAYLFSGPRGCGKTTSARILARCLNCAEGPTDTPCGVCPSCVELSRDGGGSLDVVEIDAASHNGVDDARDLRERAVFAPARDRFKIFILDEAHMVTPQGFNALLKIVEEPPEHVKFIFATTEPEKVIGTIRSRTHHYPFRLVPPAQMLEYVQSLCEAEKVEVAPGVLSLVVRAGGGSVRDTLSLLDQLIAGSDPSADSGTVTVEYERAVALLGYTHGALLDDVIDAMAARDAGAVFAAVDRVIQTGQDPRRFVEDLLERLRDLIIVAATSGNAAAVLRGIAQDELERMSAQSAAFGAAELSRNADVVNAALSEMTGATSPRLHLELMVARILVPSSDDTERGALARVERLERRVGVEGPSGAPHTPVADPAPVVERAETTTPAPAVDPAPMVERVETTASAPSPTTPVTLQQVKDAWPEILEQVKVAKLNAWMVVYTARPLELREGSVLVLSFPSQNDVDALRQKSAPGEGVGDLLKKAFVTVLGFEPALMARVDTSLAAPPPESPSTDPAAPAGDGVPDETEAPEPDLPEPELPENEAAGSAAEAPQAPDAMAEPAAEAPQARVFAPEPAAAASAPARPATPAPARPATDAAGWAVASIPGSEPPVEKPAPQPRAAREPAPTPSPEKARYGESVVREMLGASFIEEQRVAPRVIPTRGEG
jgi:DNA polymerase-3 subunit gamma/tau